MTQITGSSTKFYATSSETITNADVIANLTEIGESGYEIGEIAVTELDSDFVQTIPGEVDLGSIEIKGNLHDNAGYSKLKALVNKMASFGVLHPNSTEASFKFKGYLTSLKIGSKTKAEVVTFSATIRINSEPKTFTEPVATLSLGD